MNTAVHAQPCLMQSPPANSSGRLFVYCTLLSVTAHLALAAFLMPMQTTCCPPDLLPPATSVRIVLNTVEVTPKQPADIQPEPPPEPEKLVFLREPEAEAPPEAPIKESAPPEEDPPDQDRPPDDVDAPEEPVETESEAAAAVTTAATGGEEIAYWTSVCESIARNLQYPGRARKRGWSGTLQVHLIVGPSGQLSGTLTNADALHPSLAESVQTAIQKANPVDAPPAFLHPPVEALLPIRFQL